MKIILILVAVWAMPLSAVAGPPSLDLDRVYVGVGVTNMKNNIAVDLTPYSLPTNNAAVTIKTGYRFNDIFTIDAKLSKSESKDGRLVGITREFAEVASAYSLMAKIRTPKLSNARVYATVGWTKMNIKGKVQNSATTLSSFDDAVFDMSYGLGWEWDWAEDKGLVLEYLDLISNKSLSNNMTIDTKTLGLYLDVAF